LALQAQQSFLIARFDQFVHKGGGCREPDRQTLLAGCKTQPQADMALAGAARDSVTMPGVRRSR
jgi:hypothetical protein